MTSGQGQSAILTKRRKEKGYTQVEMAKFLGVNRKVYQRMETDKVSFYELVSICKILDLKIQIIPVENII